MSRFVYNPITRELINANPRGAIIPASAYAKDTKIIITKRTKSTSPFLKALVIIFIILLILGILYLVWLWFIREEGQSPTDIFLIFKTS